MTTIAVSETEIAWDSQLTNGNVRHQALTEKVSVIGKTIYGCAGDAGACQHAPEWHAKGARVRSAPKGEWTMLVVTRRGLRVYDENSGQWAVVSNNIAVAAGSGMKTRTYLIPKTSAWGINIAAGRFDEAYVEVEMTSLGTPGALLKADAWVNAK